MKCPKCGYIGFEQAEKCRNCGYDFSLLKDPVIDFDDLPLKRDEPLAAPADFDFRIGEPPRAAATPRARDSDFDLPSPPPRSPARDLPLFQPASASSAPSTPALVPANPAAPPLSSAGTAAASSSPGTAAMRPPAAKEPLPVQRRPASSLRARPVPAVFDFRETEAAEQETSGEGAPAPRTSTGATSHAAGSLARAIAGMLDAIILLGLDAGVLYFTLRVCRLSFADTILLPLAPLIAFFLLLDGGYLVAFTAVGGQTIGKMAASLKVVSEEGDRVVPGQAMVRAIGYFASALPAGLGFVPGLFGPTRRALHDRLANTRVVRL